MMRDWRYVPRKLLGEKYFRWRGGDVSRIEGLSDAVFALAMTMLVISVEVPRSFTEMKADFTQLPSFAISFAILVLCWYTNYKFHRRYGIEDLRTVLLTAIQLFLILFYVYPLQFLFTWLLEGFMGLKRTVTIEDGDIPMLMLCYSGGFAAIFLVFALMYVHAWRFRDDLGLDHNERVITRSGISSHLVSVGVALLSMLLVLIDAKLSPLAGIIYFIMGPAQAVNGFFWGRKIDESLVFEPGEPRLESGSNRGVEAGEVGHPDAGLDGAEPDEEIDQRPVG